jgi:hypothetical protein
VALIMPFFLFTFAHTFNSPHQRLNHARLYNSLFGTIYVYWEFKLRLTSLSIDTKISIQQAGFEPMQQNITEGREPEAGATSGTEIGGGIVVAPCRSISEIGLEVNRQRDTTGGRKLRHSWCWPARHLQMLQGVDTIETPSMNITPNLFVWSLCASAALVVSEPRICSVLTNL